MALSAFRFEMRDDFVAYPKTAEFNEQTYTGEFLQTIQREAELESSRSAQTLSYLPGLAGS